MAWGKCVTGFWGLPGEGEELQDELQRPPNLCAELNLDVVLCCVSFWVEENRNLEEVAKLWCYKHVFCFCAKPNSSRFAFYFWRMLV